jgi:hypothetical protein
LTIIEEKKKKIYRKIIRPVLPYRAKKIKSNFILFISRKLANKPNGLPSGVSGIPMAFA